MRFPSYRSAPALVVMSLLAGSTVAAEPVIQWRADYSAARKEAQEKGLPLLVEVGTEDCFYCKKQDATTFRDPGLVALVNARFIAVRVDANRDPAFAQALQVQLYPTTVLGAPDGKILSFLQGYTSVEQMRDHLKRATPAVSVPELPAKDLLTVAKEEFRAQRYADCLDTCARLAGSPEAESLAAKVTGDAEKLAIACEQRNEKTAALLVQLAEAHEKQGKEKDARECLEKAAKLCPTGKTGERAQAKLASFQK